MDVPQAHKDLSEAQHSIRYFFLVDEDLEVICRLLEQAKTAPTLKMAVAYAHVARVALKAIAGENDECTIAGRYIEDAIAEFRYQSRPKRGVAFKSANAARATMGLDPVPGPCPRER